MLIFSSYIFQNTRLPIILSGSYKNMPMRARIPTSEYPYRDNANSKAHLSTAKACYNGTLGTGIWYRYREITLI
jgi:hypothetical protein